MPAYVAVFWILLVSLTTLAWAGRDRTASWTAALVEPATGAAALLAVAAMLTVVLRPSVATRFAGIDPSMLGIDAGLFLGLAALGLRSGRWWVLCAAALQLLSATAHLARATTPAMWRLGYQVMEEASSYPTLLLLAWGLWERSRTARTAARSRSFSVAPDRLPLPPPVPPSC